MQYRIGKARRVKVNYCPTCRGTLDGETSIVLGEKEEVPARKEGDLGICWNCGQLLRLDADLRPVKATPEEIEEIELEVRKVLLAMSEQRRAQWLAYTWRNN